MSLGRPNFKRIQKTVSRNIASNQSASSSGHASKSIGTSRPNDSRPDASRPNASRQNASLSNASRPASPTPESDDGSSGDNGTMPRRNSCGPSRGISLDKYFGKMKIVFNSRERNPIKYEEDFANGIGIAIRTCRQLDGVSLWKEVPAETKLILYEHLEKKDHSPIKQIENVWLSPTLQGGEVVFLYSERWLSQEIMIELKNTAVLEGEITMTEAEILEVILGHRSGYKKCMGSGVEVPRVTKRLRAQEIKSSNEKINSLTTEFEQQKEENKNNKELISILNAENKSNKETIQSLTTQVERFNQFMRKFPEFGQSCIKNLTGKEVIGVVIDIKQ
ncbi:hypothetical protein OROHE_007451 [Orobanche hederae]